MQPKISIIMTVYNAAKYLHRAIDSILAQTMQDFELICIDDGSTDSSGRILDEYAQKDPRIRVFHKQNEGVAMARQLGVDMAQGEYSIHADSDDWVEPTMLEELYKKAKEENADMVIADYYQNYSDGREELMQQHPTRLNTPDQIDDIFFGGFFSGLPLKLIRHSIYKEYDVRFFPGVNYCEDVLVCVQILKHNNLKIVHTPKAYYHYLANESSITHNVTRKTYEALSAFRNKLNEILPEDKYSRIRNQVTLSLFVECFQKKGILTNEEMRHLSHQMLPAVLKQVGLRYKIGFLFVQLGLYDIARKFIRY